MPPKTSYIVMTDAPSPTQRELASWVESTFGKNVTQGTISNTLKRSAELLAASGAANQSGKRHKAVNYPLMVKVLLMWFQRYQGEVARSEELLKSKGAHFPWRLYPDAYQFEYLNGWMDYFKSWYDIKYYRRFDKIDLVDMVSLNKRDLACGKFLTNMNWGHLQYGWNWTFYRTQIVYLRLTEALLILNTTSWMYYRLIIRSQENN